MKNNHPPNVLFLICDDFNNAIAGMDRRPFAPAPNLQRLARRGVRFVNAQSKDSLWEESCQIPLIVHAPELCREGAVCHAPVSHVDLYPTLLDICGLPSEPHATTHGLPLDGRSLAPLLADPDAETGKDSCVALSSVRGDSGVHHSVRSATHRYTLCGNGEERTLRSPHGPV